MYWHPNLSKNAGIMPYYLMRNPDGCIDRSDVLVSNFVFVKFEKSRKRSNTILSCSPKPLLHLAVPLVSKPYGVGVFFQTTVTLVSVL